MTATPISKIASVLTAGLIAVAGVFAVTPQAHADERNLVAFGDSVLADPDLGSYLTMRITGQSFNGVNCPRSNNFAQRAAAKMGMPARDFSCSGAAAMSPGPQISAQVDAAIGSGALNAGTARVVFMSGFNDTYNNPNLNMQQIRERYVGATAPQIQRIRQAAPNARIQIVGYPTIGSGNTYCLFHAFGTSDRTLLPQIADYENKAQWMAVDLAGATGTEFVDLKPHTRDNGMCAPDNQREWAGIVDFDAGAGNLPMHVNARGHEHAANIIAGS